MAEKSALGRFVWHELLTPDPAGAQTFYSKVLGWKSQPWEQDPSYVMFVGPSGPLGGTVSLASGTPRWLNYIATNDAAGTVGKARSLGASVTKDVTDMPNGGKYAELRDPQGAAFAVYQSATDGGKESAPKRGEFSWHELATTDYKAAISFYSALFGWQTMQEHDMGEMGVYLIFGSNGVQRGGMMNKPPQMQGDPMWGSYVRVKNVHEAVKKAKAARGTLINGPMEVPGGDWIAQLLDPYGAFFAVHTVAADMKAAQPAAAVQVEPTRAVEAPITGATDEPAAPKKKVQRVAKKAAKKKAPQKKAPQKKAARKKASAKKAAPRRKRPAAKSAKRPTRKVAKAARKRGPKRKVSAQRKRSGGKTRTAKKTPRKGK